MTAIHSDVISTKNPSIQPPLNVKQVTVLQSAHIDPWGMFDALTASIVTLPLPAPLGPKIAELRLEQEPTFSFSKHSSDLYDEAPSKEVGIRLTQKEKWEPSKGPSPFDLLEAQNFEIALPKESALKTFALDLSDEETVSLVRDTGDLALSFIEEYFATTVPHEEPSPPPSLPIAGITSSVAGPVWELYPEQLAFSVELTQKSPLVRGNHLFPSVTWELFRPALEKSPIALKNKETPISSPKEVKARPQPQQKAKTPSSFSPLPHSTTFEFFEQYERQAPVASGKPTETVPQSDALFSEPSSQTQTPHIEKKRFEIFSEQLPQATQKRATSLPAQTTANPRFSVYQPWELFDEQLLRPFQRSVFPFQEQGKNQAWELFQDSLTLRPLSPLKTEFYVLSEPSPPKQIRQDIPYRRKHTLCSEELKGIRWDLFEEHLPSPFQRTKRLLETLSQLQGAWELFDRETIPRTSKPSALTDLEGDLSLVQELKSLQKHLLQMDSFISTELSQISVRLQKIQKALETRDLTST
ncbi:hypothetical protein WDW89_14470 [Deltaproteobacteria bacterium TL4]